MIDRDTVLSVMILGVFLVSMLNFVYFFNVASLMNLLFKIIAPKKKFEEVERDLALYKNKLFKSHLKKWKTKFLLNIVVFIDAFTVVLIFVKDIFGSFLIGLIITIIGYGVLSELENKARKKVISLINQNNEANQGDDSLID